MPLSSVPDAGPPTGRVSRTGMPLSQATALSHECCQDLSFLNTQDSAVQQQQEE